MEVYAAGWQRIGKDAEGIGCGSLFAWTYLDEQRKAPIYVLADIRTCSSRTQTRSNTV